ncbi:toxin-activating lysine-acyltransferase [Sulfurimonas sp.]|uniref:toxin-activating lysine-acyltransferase n=1 Tax=Sulfurimonas sp. TaxID=2022749 RepID=UPI002B49CE66|nr:toxin-activating lysine-acyltransferase [Sulfurimonas sp.]
METSNNLNRMDIEILSDALFLALHSEDYKDVTITSFYNRFIETIKVGNFQLLREKESNLSIAFTSWAFVSDEVLSELVETRRDIKEEEINSGENLLFIELFSTSNNYWDFFDFLTNYFNNEYQGEYSVNKTKIFTCCGMKIGFENDTVKITRPDEQLSL